MITLITDTNISLSWTEPSILNEEVVYYQVSLYGSYVGMYVCVHTNYYLILVLATTKPITKMYT